MCKRNVLSWTKRMWTNRWWWLCMHSNLYNIRVAKPKQYYMCRLNGYLLFCVVFIKYTNIVLTLWPGCTHCNRLNIFRIDISLFPSFFSSFPSFFCCMPVDKLAVCVVGWQQPKMECHQENQSRISVASAKQLRSIFEWNDHISLVGTRMVCTKKIHIRCSLCQTKNGWKKISLKCLFTKNGNNLTT